MQQLGILFDQESATNIQTSVFEGAGFLSDPKRLGLKADRPVLVISCSDAKVESEGYIEAGDLYLGDMFKYLRSNGYDKSFNVFIMSAKFGLIHQSEFIRRYNLQILDVSPEQYEQVHANGLRKRLAIASKGQPVFVFLPIAYRTVFERCFNEADSESLEIMRRSAGVYICYHHQGNGDQKQRLAMASNLTTRRYLTGDVCQSKRLITEGEAGHRPDVHSTTVFRSGCASNVEEIRGYTLGGQSIGSSLAHLDGKPDVIRSVILASLSAPSFVDNGMLQLIHKNQLVDMDSLLDGYGRFVEQMKGIVREEDGCDEDSLSHIIHSENQYLSNMYFVLPDDPMNIDSQIDLLVRRREFIQHLADRGVSWILPLHKRRGSTEDLDKRVKQIYELFDNPSWLVIGIPTLSDTERDFALSTAEIEMILGVKVNKERLVKRIHFLGQGDTNPGVKAKNRILLAKLYGVEVSMDSQRTRATFQKSRIKQNTAEIVRREEMKRLSSFISELKESEFEYPSLLDEVRDYCYSAGVEQFLQRWNSYADSSACKLSYSECEGEIDDWFDEVMLMMPDSGYVDVWVAMNLPRFFKEAKLEPLKGNQRREPILAHEFGSIASRASLANATELVKLM